MSDKARVLYRSDRVMREGGLCVTRNVRECIQFNLFLNNVRDQLLSQVKTKCHPNTEESLSSPHGITVEDVSGPISPGLSLELTSNGFLTERENS